MASVEVPRRMSHFDPDHLPPVTSVLKNGDVPDFSGLDDDDAALAALGYKAEFKREFSLWTTFCVSFAVLGLLPSFASTLYYGMGYAGQGGMVWGWIIAFFFILCVALSMAELCSSMPTSGGLYYASAVLAPPGWGPFASWFTGWSNWVGLITGAPSVNYALSAMLLAAVSIANPEFEPTRYQTFLLAAFVMIIHACLSSMPTRWIANFNAAGTMVNILALLVVVITIPASVLENPLDGLKFRPSSEVWSITNGTAYPDGIAILMSFISIIWTMSGYDAPFHLSEECSNAAVAAPRAIVLTAGVGGLAGWAIQLVVAYTVVDIAAVISPDPELGQVDYGQPWAGYLIQVLPRNTAMALLALTVVCAFSMGQGCMVATSRVTFAYARDDCLPFSSVLKRVNRHTLTPVNAVWFNTTIGIAMLLLIFAGDIAIGALFSVGAIAAYTAFTTPIFIRVFLVGNRFRRGPWHLGKFSRPIGTAACSFVLLMLPILCLPSVTGSDLTVELMNWTVLVFGGPMFLVMVWWLVSARKWFKGPKVNAEHHMMGRGVAVDGIEDSAGSGSDSAGPDKERELAKGASLPVYGEVK